MTGTSLPKMTQEGAVRVTVQLLETVSEAKGGVDCSVTCVGRLVYGTDFCLSGRELIM
jgi:hypothetical protein